MVVERHANCLTREIERIDSRAAENQEPSRWGGRVCHVGKDLVLSRAPVKCIGVGSAGERIIAAVADQVIVAGSTVEVIVAFASGECVIATQAEDKNSSQGVRARNVVVPLGSIDVLESTGCRT